MKLQYKIITVMMFFSIFILGSISVIYSRISYQEVMQKEHEILLDSAVESAHYIEVQLLDKLALTQTLSSAPIILDTLLKSNQDYYKLSVQEQKEKIAKLNEKWKRAKSAEDVFIKAYLNNTLAQFLKKQQSVLPGVYGEIFITNRYGAMIATTGKLSTLAHSHKYWWQEGYNKGKGKVFFDDRGFDESVQGYVIGIVIPIKKDGEIIGILKSNINIIGTLKSVIDNYAAKNRGSLKIVRTKGIVVLEEGTTPLSTNVNTKLLHNLNHLDTGSKIITMKEQDCLVAYAPVRETIDHPNIAFGGKLGSGEHRKGNQAEVWHTVICYDTKEALASSTEANEKIIYTTVFFIVLSLLLAIFIGRWISRDELKQEIIRRKNAEAEIVEKDKLMIVQSRHAAMGEMISMIAHQWRQPISVISMSANNILADIELATVKEDTLKRTSENIINQTQELSKTIDDFRNFFRTEKEAKEVFVNELVSEALGVVGKSLENYYIEFVTEINDSYKITTYTRELMQVFINIIKNAQEALVENNIENKKVTIYASEDKNNLTLRICDNAGGVKEENMEKIFNPYFTTKSEKNGTGLGLYMSKTIVQKHLNGILTVYNLDDGACFEIRLPLEIKEQGVLDE